MIHAPRFMILILLLGVMFNFIAAPLALAAQAPAQTPSPTANIESTLNQAGTKALGFAGTMLLWGLNAILTALLIFLARFVVMSGVFFDLAIKRFGKPEQLLSDHGTQFCSDDNKTFRFKEHLKSKGVELIHARVKHPQTNGKLE